jgi:hypothetical protein
MICFNFFSYSKNYKLLTSDGSPEKIRKLFKESLKIAEQTSYSSADFQNIFVSFLNNKKENEITINGSEGRVDSEIESNEEIVPEKKIKFR